MARFVQSSTLAQSSTSTNSNSFTISPALAKGQFVIGSYQVQPNVTINSVAAGSDALTITTSQAQWDTNGVYIIVFSGPIVVGGATSITINTASAITGWDGGSLDVYADVFGVNAHTATWTEITTANPGVAINPTVANCILWVTNWAENTATQPTGFTLRVNTNSLNGLYTADKVTQLTSGSVTPTWTQTALDSMLAAYALTPMIYPPTPRLRTYSLTANIKH